MPNANGSMWVQAQYLYWRDNANTRWRFLGTTVATPAGAVKGSIWLEANTVHYIDETGGVERYVDGPAIAASSPAGKAGSMWIDTGYAPSSAKGQLHFLGDTGHEFWSHNDVTASASHTDTPYSNGHTDTTPYSNSHTDANPHTNSHYDSPHGDNHSNTFEPLGHYDFGDYYAHGNNHTDEAPHSNVHTDQSDPYANSHTDVPYSNSHTDVPHVDRPETV